jgi:hypothetical protein
MTNATEITACRYMATEFVIIVTPSPASTGLANAGTWMKIYTYGKFVVKLCSIATRDLLTAAYLDVCVSLRHEELPEVRAAARHGYD